MMEPSSEMISVIGPLSSGLEFILLICGGYPNMMCSRVWLSLTAVKQLWTYFSSAAGEFATRLWISKSTFPCWSYSGRSFFSFWMLTAVRYENFQSSSFCLILGILIITFMNLIKWFSSYNTLEKSTLPILCRYKLPGLAFNSLITALSKHAGSDIKVT